MIRAEESRQKVSELEKSVLEHEKAVTEAKEQISELESAFEKALEQCFLKRFWLKSKFPRKVWKIT